MFGILFRYDILMYKKKGEYNEKKWLNELRKRERGGGVVNVGKKQLFVPSRKIRV